MKSLIVLIVGLLAVGCATTATTTKSMTGVYGAKVGNVFSRVLLLENGEAECYLDGDSAGKCRWYKKDGLIHIESGSGHHGLNRINPDGTFTGIAQIDKNGKRTDTPKEKQVWIWKKSVMAEIYGAKVGNDGNDYNRFLKLENGKAESYNNGRQSGKCRWYKKDGVLHIVGESGHHGFNRLNPDGTFTFFAQIDKNGKRTDWPIENRSTWKKIK